MQRYATTHALTEVTT